MHHLEGKDTLRADQKRFAGHDCFQLQPRHAGIFTFPKCIVELTSQGILRFRRAINGDGRLLLEVKRPNVVHAGNVVFMGVGNQYSVEMPDILPKHLVTEIGAGIHHDGEFAIFDQY